MTIIETVQRVRNLEGELESARRVAGRTLRSCRRKLKLTLREAADVVGNVSPATIHNTEKNKAWNTDTAERIARRYEKLAA